MKRQICPICMGYMLKHQELRGWYKCSCGYCHDENGKNLLADPWSWPAQNNGVLDLGMSKEELVKAINENAEEISKRIEKMSEGVVRLSNGRYYGRPKKS